jgi:hypothetical protein
MQDHINGKLDFTKVKSHKLENIIEQRSFLLEIFKSFNKQVLVYQHTKKNDKISVVKIIVI